MIKQQVTEEKYHFLRLEASILLEKIIPNWSADSVQF